MLYVAIIGILHRFLTSTSLNSEYVVSSDGGVLTTKSAIAGQWQINANIQHNRANAMVIHHTSTKTGVMTP